MQALAAAGTEAVDRIAARHGFSVDATQSMLDALVRGGGRMAQFNHAEFSGPGQWMRGGMTMVSDMFNQALKARVDALASDLARLVDDQPVQTRSSGVAPASHATASSEPPRTASSGWPAGLGQPSSSGAQNGSRYAVFNAAHRLAIEQDGRITVFDTLDHRIGGISQQQGATGSMRFTSQHGIVDLERLPRVSSEPGAIDAGSASPGRFDIPATIERLADLKAKGILSTDEFDAKKAELLARL